MSPVSNYLDGLSNLVTAAQAGIPGLSSSGGQGGSLPSLPTSGSIGTGTKPKALHTEYASGEANWEKPYATGEDIVFYMVRADKGGSGVKNSAAGISGEDDLGIFAPGQGQNQIGNEAFSNDLGLNYSEGMSAVGPTFGAAAQTGANFADGIQSPLNQVGVFSKMSSLPSFTGGMQGLAGPLTGLDVNAEVPVGAFSQTFAKLESTVASVQNLTQYVPSLESLRLSGPSSEKFFADVLTSSFVPDFGQDEIVSAVKSAQEIESSISNGSISDLSSMLSMATGGVTTAKQFIEGINKGIIGVTSQGSGAEAERLGPQGFSRERLIK